MHLDRMTYIKRRLSFGQTVSKLCDKDFRFSMGKQWKLSVNVANGTDNNGAICLTSIRCDQED